jgi:hypothetical protein
MARTAASKYIPKLEANERFVIDAKNFREAVPEHDHEHEHNDNSNRLYPFGGMLCQELHRVYYAKEVIFEVPIWHPCDYQIQKSSIEHRCKDQVDR